MANNYFSFKQFTIQQEHCAMKVCTDACLFGAWSAQLIENDNSITNILDIGTGTGLLSLMLAQKTDANITAIEIDKAAAEQANENFEASNWKDRMLVKHLSAQAFESEKVFDFIISNPPFFDNDLKSIDEKRNLALHSKELSFEELLIAIQKNLSIDGSFAVLLPYHRTLDFIKLTNNLDFYLHKNISVKQTPTHAAFRSVLLFSTKQKALIEETMIIKDGEYYTSAFGLLLKDYYLK